MFSGMGTLLSGCYGHMDLCRLSCVSFPKLVSQFFLLLSLVGLVFCTYVRSILTLKSEGKIQKYKIQKHFDIKRN